jgi:hypothetical protein
MTSHEIVIASPPPTTSRTSGPWQIKRLFVLLPSVVETLAPFRGRRGGDVKCVNFFPSGKTQVFVIVSDTAIRRVSKDLLLSQARLMISSLPIQGGKMRNFLFPVNDARKCEVKKISAKH